MSHNLSVDEVNDVTAHHEAGHAATMVKCDIPILNFERLKDGSAQVVPDPSSTAKDLIGLYARFLATRASRYSQKLSSFNNAEVERASFAEDDRQLDGQAKRLYALFSPKWKNEKPTSQQFKNELLRVADAELGATYADAPYVTFVRGIAAAFMQATRMTGEEIKRLAEKEWEGSGISLEFIRYGEFSGACLRDTPAPSERE